MQLGNRRFVVVAALGALLAGALSGCSSGGSLTDPDAAAVSIGQQARGFSSPSATTGWSSGVKCPKTLKQALFPTTQAGTSVTTLDAASTTGVISEPTVTEGDIPTCAYAVTVGDENFVALIFVGMGTSYQKPVLARLVADGFVAGATTTEAQGTEEIYTRGTTRIDIQAGQVDGVSVFVVIG